MARPYFLIYFYYYKISIKYDIISIYLMQSKQIILRIEHFMVNNRYNISYGFICIIVAKLINRFGLGHTQPENLKKAVPID